MIRQTIDRAHKIIPNSKILTVVTSHHSLYYNEELRHRPDGTIIVQPCPRDTGAGIFLPLAKIYKTDQDSTVAVFPSDHFIQNENRFINHVKEAALFVEKNPELIVIIGVRPEKIESGLGWMERGDKIHSYNDLNFNYVVKFWEKPDSATAAVLYSKQCLVNTFITVGKSKTILNQMKNRLPHFFEAFSPIIDSLGTEHEKITIQRFFKFIPTVNFSRDFLEIISAKLAVLEVSDIYWSDWGEEKRVKYDMDRFNLSFRNNTVQRPSAAGREVPIYTRA